MAGSRQVRYRGRSRQVFLATVSLGEDSSSKLALATLPWRLNCSRLAGHLFPAQSLSWVNLGLRPAWLSFLLLLDLGSCSHSSGTQV